MSLALQEYYTYVQIKVMKFCWNAGNVMIKKYLDTAGVYICRYLNCALILAQLFFFAKHLETTLVKSTKEFLYSFSFQEPAGGTAKLR